jgi:hypothetical protein
MTETTSQQPACASTKDLRIAANKANELAALGRILLEKASTYAYCASRDPDFDHRTLLENINDLPAHIDRVGCEFRRAAGITD